MRAVDIASWVTLTAGCALALAAGCGYRPEARETASPSAERAHQPEMRPPAPPAGGRDAVGAAKAEKDLPRSLPPEPPCEASEPSLTKGEEAARGRDAARATAAARAARAEQVARAEAARAETELEAKRRAQAEAGSKMKAGDKVAGGDEIGSWEEEPAAGEVTAPPPKPAPPGAAGAQPSKPPTPPEPAAAGAPGAGRRAPPVAATTGLDDEELARLKRLLALAANRSAARLSVQLGGGACRVTGVELAPDGASGRAFLSVPGRLVGEAGRVLEDGEVVLRYHRDAAGGDFDEGEVTDRGGKRFALALQMLKR
ncbi:MAG: hypothetical protein HY719_13415 [Planctomycetes bacterium]|nr:hypothetical protein [Planctomycetota bacterium]